MSFEMVYSNDIWSVLSSASREVKLDHPAPDFIHSHRDLSCHWTHLESGVQQLRNSSSFFPDHGPTPSCFYSLDRTLNSCGDGCVVGQQAWGRSQACTQATYAKSEQ